jgi:hypothetical protein
VKPPNNPATDGSWSWTKGEQYPSFWVCRRCRLYWCSQWGTGVHTTHEHRVVPVIKGYAPPQGFEPSQGPLEMLARVAREWEKEQT